MPRSTPPTRLEARTGLTLCAVFSLLLASGALMVCATLAWRGVM